MPWSPNKRCGQINCTKLVPHGTRYCEDHQREKWRREDKSRVRERFYNSTEWIALRNWKRNHAPLCEECKRLGITKRMYIVDHITPISEGGAKLDPANLQSLCNECHQRKRAREIKNPFGKRKV